MYILPITEHCTYLTNDCDCCPVDGVTTAFFTKAFGTNAAAWVTPTNRAKIKQTLFLMVMIISSLMVQVSRAASVYEPPIQYNTLFHYRFMLACFLFAVHSVSDIRVRQLHDAANVFNSWHSKDSRRVPVGSSFCS
jgi:hypothetical protein